jgi:hypothetical protein
LSERLKTSERSVYAREGRFRHRVRVESCLERTDHPSRDGGILRGRLRDALAQPRPAVLAHIFGWATSWKPATKILTIRRYEHAEMVPSRVGSSTSSMTPPLGGLSTTRSGVHRTPRSASASVHRKQLDFHSSLLWHARRTSSSLHLAPTGQDHDQPSTSSAMVLRTPRSPRTPRTPLLGRRRHAERGVL